MKLIPGEIVLISFRVHVYATVVRITQPVRLVLQTKDTAAFALLVLLEKTVKMVRLDVRVFYYYL